MKNNRLVTLFAILLALVATSACLFSGPVTPTLEPYNDRPLLFAPDKLMEAEVGVAYEMDIFVAQNDTPVGEFGISDGALPKGLKLEKIENEDVARISGAPEETGEFAFTVSVWCYGTNTNGQTGEKSYTLTVK